MAKSFTSALFCRLIKLSVCPLFYCVQVLFFIHLRNCITLSFILSALFFFHKLYFLCRTLLSFVCEKWFTEIFLLC